ncbi:DUF2971 domain-containing protein [Aeromonas veronii]
MNVLYKYYSSNFNLIDHIKRPLIKLSHTESFNDPFECALSEKLAEKLTEYQLSQGFIKDEYKEIFKQDFKIEYMNTPKEYGVVSLTETHRNILMWAHYANSHRGVCIGYKRDFLNSKLEINSQDPYKNKLDMTPKRVRYDSQRFDIQKYNFDKTINTKPIHHIIESMTLKSNDWMYEKEHRCIVPFRYGEYIKLISTPTKALAKIIERLEKSSLITKLEHAHEYEISKNAKLGKLHDFNINLGRIAKEPYAMILKEIDVEKIHSIHLGCQYDKSAQSDIEMFLKINKEKFGHIRLYRYAVNSQSFDIIERVIK